MPPSSHKLKQEANSIISAKHLHHKRMSGETAELLAGRKSKKVIKCLTAFSTVLGLVTAIITITATSLSVENRGRINQIAGEQPQQGYLTYQRIGSRYSCPNVSGTTLVYEGFTAGFTIAAGATTYGCLPKDEKDIKYYPQDANSKYNNASEVRFVNMAEYRTFKPDRNNYDVPCVVCSITGRGTIQVVQASYHCQDSSWTLEYSGYLMTDETATTFVCVDFKMDTIANTPNPRPGAPTLRHIVVPDNLGSFTDNYDQEKVLSCAVCTK